MIVGQINDRRPGFDMRVMLLHHLRARVPEELRHLHDADAVRQGLGGVGQVAESFGEATHLSLVQPLAVLVGDVQAEFVDEPSIQVD